jgi:hypothetical protein
MKCPISWVRAFWTSCPCGTEMTARSPHTSSTPLISMSASRISPVFFSVVRVVSASAFGS